jgi:hypothetical protein
LNSFLRCSRDNFHRAHSPDEECSIEAP